jgi:ABC-type polysaccharide/polyol phosphate transport system ATPase subunit
MTVSDFAIQVENLGKRYRIGLTDENPDTLFGALGKWMRSPVQNYRQLRNLSTFQTEDAQDIIWALRDVSFQVRYGEVLGIIGHNGAGKSTLLKVLSRITPPTKGSILLNGRVASLLEVGTGFHPELTGRENIYLNGTILGMTRREVDRRFDEIVDFSGIEAFIDTPVKRYSSGMRVRLAFAVAAHLEPEILLIDEVLAVGDVAFQQKSFQKMESVAGEGRTVLLVSHNIGAVTSLTERCLVFEHGILVKDGPTEQSVNYYLDSMSKRVKNDGYVDLSQAERAKSRNKGDGPPRTLAELCAVRTLDDQETTTSIIKEGFPFHLEISFSVKKPVKTLQLACRVRMPQVKRPLFSVPSPRFQGGLVPGEYQTILHIEPNYLKAGFYNVELRLFANGNQKNQDSVPLATQFTIVAYEDNENDAYQAELVGGMLRFDYAWQPLHRTNHQPDRAGVFRDG